MDTSEGRDYIANLRTPALGITLAKTRVQRTLVVTRLQVRSVGQARLQDRISPLLRGVFQRARDSASNSPKAASAAPGASQAST